MLIIFAAIILGGVWYMLTQFGDELEHAGACLGVTGDQRVLHRRRAAPAREQREVQIDPAVYGRRQQRLADEAAVRDDHAEVGTECRDALGDLRVEPVGAERVQAELFGGGGDR